MTVRQILSREFAVRRRTILLLLGEKAGMREGVKQFSPQSRQDPKVQGKLESFFAVLSPNIVTSCEDFPRSALALSAAPHPKAVLKPRAVQTLRDCRVSSNRAQRLECGRVHRRCHPARSGDARKPSSIPGWEMPPQTIRWRSSSVGKHRSSTLDWGCGTSRAMSPRLGVIICRGLGSKLVARTVR
jgi:hypothetical protein